VQPEDVVCLKPISPQQAWDVLQKAERLYAPDAVEAALDRMARDITGRLARANPLLVCVMTGGVVPFGKLLPRLQFPLEIDYVHATRYGEKLYGGDLHWRVGPSQEARGRAVLLVDDILDEGDTLAAIEKRYRAEGATDVYKAVLVVKDRARSAAVPVEFKGLDVPNRYVFGYGMDYQGYLRNAPGIYAEANE
jgi:hypoxanthine phosphoribosyltransferase